MWPDAPRRFLINLARRSASVAWWPHPRNGPPKLGLPPANNTYAQLSRVLHLHLTLPQLVTSSTTPIKARASASNLGYNPRLETECFFHTEVP